MGTHIMVYRGYGHTDDLIVYGHVLKNVPAKTSNSRNLLGNIIHMLRLFFVKPVAGANVRLYWQKQVLETVTGADGFFRFEWKSDEHVAAGWHSVKVVYLDAADHILASADGEVFVPHVTQFAFVSDIDDTVMVSHSATKLKRLWELFLKSGSTRSIFKGVAEHYRLLAQSHTDVHTPNPFFYVSSSEWNLYYYLLDFFKANQLPEGSFLLSQLKRWYQLFKTGKTKHEGKLLRILRIFQAFPKQQFVLLGDNSQSDPLIYEAVINKYPGKIHAVYLRNIKKKNEEATTALLKTLEEKGVHVCLFDKTEEAIAHSKKIGLIG